MDVGHVMRDGEFADAAAIVAITAQAMRASDAAQGSVLFPLTREGVLNDMETGDATYTVYKINGALAAYVKHGKVLPVINRSAAWHIEPVDLTDGIYIEKIVVMERFRRSGIGRALYTGLSTRFVGRPICAFVVVSPQANRASIGFHAALGFECVAHVPSTMPGGGPITGALLVRRAASMALAAPSPASNAELERAPSEGHAEHSQHP